ncbi:hypothetical protein [Nocardia abscessus]|uniref:hypothetical protein n=1 Tax=Nocardia abscessus TaxID=120957 RepID=UPI0012F8C08A|nr:hypothetical protein [Nocardia abscessus]MCC3333553.1 hypothetical protein [Nocardia abscessus]
MSPQTTRRHQTPTVRPATEPGGGKAGHRDALASLVLHSALSRPGSGIVSNEHEVAEAILAAGWRPPAERIETPEGLAILPTGSVIRSCNGTICSIDHGGAGEWRGMHTVLDFAATFRMTVAEVAKDLPESFPWTVLHAPDIPEGPGDGNS